MAGRGPVTLDTMRLRSGSAELAFRAASLLTIATAFEKKPYHSCVPSQVDKEPQVHHVLMACLNGIHERWGTLWRSGERESAWLNQIFAGVWSKSFWRCTFPLLLHKWPPRRRLAWGKSTLPGYLPRSWSVLSAPSHVFFFLKQLALTYLRYFFCHTTASTL